MFHYGIHIHIHIRYDRSVVNVNYRKLRLDYQREISEMAYSMEEVKRFLTLQRVVDWTKLKIITIGNTSIWQFVLKLFVSKMTWNGLSGCGTRSM